MDFERLRQIDRLFVNRWDAFIVASLAAGPMRFNALAYDVMLHTRTKVSDSTLTRGKERLLRADIVQIITDDEGHHAYALTAKGHAIAATINALTEALDKYQYPATEYSDIIPPT